MTIIWVLSQFDTNGRASGNIFGVTQIKNNNNNNNNDNAEMIARYESGNNGNVRLIYDEITTCQYKRIRWCYKTDRLMISNFHIGCPIVNIKLNSILTNKICPKCLSARHSDAPPPPHSQDSGISFISWRAFCFIRTHSPLHVIKNDNECVAGTWHVRHSLTPP